MNKLELAVNAGKSKDITDAIKGLYPIPQINVGTNEEPVWRDEFDEEEWVKEKTRRWLIKQVARYKQKVAVNAIKYEEENDLLT